MTGLGTLLAQQLLGPLPGKRGAADASTAAHATAAANCSWSHAEAAARAHRRAHAARRSRPAAPAPTAPPAPHRPRNPLGLLDLHRRRIQCAKQESFSSRRPHLNAYGAARMLERIAAVPIRCGWHDLAPTDRSMLRAWRADPAGGGVTVQIRRRRRDFEVTASAPSGSRLRSRRCAVSPTWSSPPEQEDDHWMTTRQGTKKARHPIWVLACGFGEPEVGVEPTTFRLRGKRSSSD
jgi:hypothetical protein